MNYFLSRLMVVVLSTIVLMPNAFAQEENERMIRYGPRIGVTVSTFSNSQPHTSTNTGFTAGGFIEYRLTDKFALQAEPSYLQQGGSFVRFSDDSRFGSGTIPMNTTSSKITVHSIDLPVLIKYQLATLGELKVNTVLGPSVSYVVGALNEYETTYYENQSFTTVNDSKDVSSQYEPFTLGAVAGFGGEVSMGTKAFFIDFRYRYGITPVKKGYSYIELYDVQGDLNTHSAYVTIGISL